MNGEGKRGEERKGEEVEAENYGEARGERVSRSR